MIAAMEAWHKLLTTQKSLYGEISRARDRAELVTNDAAELRAQLEALTGEADGFVFSSRITSDSCVAIFDRAGGRMPETPKDAIPSTWRWPL